MSRRIWYYIWAINPITVQWQMIAKVRSPGLAQIIYNHLLTLYDDVEVR